MYEVIEGTTETQYRVEKGGNLFVLRVENGALEDRDASPGAIRLEKWAGGKINVLSGPADQIRGLRALDEFCTIAGIPCLN